MWKTVWWSLQKWKINYHRIQQSHFWIYIQRNWNQNPGGICNPLELSAPRRAHAGLRELSMTVRSPCAGTVPTEVSDFLCSPVHVSNAGGSDPPGDLLFLTYLRRVADFSACSGFYLSLRWYETFNILTCQTRSISFFKLKVITVSWNERYILLEIEDYYIWYMRPL